MLATVSIEQIPGCRKYDILGFVIMGSLIGVCASKIGAEFACIYLNKTVIAVQQIIKGGVAMAVIDGVCVGQHIVHITADIAMIQVVVTIVAQDPGPCDDMAVGLYLGAGDRVQYMQTRTQPTGLESGSHSCRLVALPTTVVFVNILEQILAAVTNKKVLLNGGVQAVDNPIFDFFILRLLTISCHIIPPFDAFSCGYSSKIPIYSLEVEAHFRATI